MFSSLRVSLVIVSLHSNGNLTEKIYKLPIVQYLPGFSLWVIETIGKRILPLAMLRVRLLLSSRDVTFVSHHPCWSGFCSCFWFIHCPVRNHSKLTSSLGQQNHFFGLLLVPHGVNNILTIPPRKKSHHIHYGVPWTICDYWWFMIQLVMSEDLLMLLCLRVPCYNGGKRVSTSTPE